MAGGVGGEKMPIGESAYERKWHARRVISHRLRAKVNGLNAIVKMNALSVTTAQQFNT